MQIYKKTHQPPRQRVFRQGKEPPAGEKLMVKLAACIAILIAAVIIKTLFPGFSETFGDKILKLITGDVDYRAAFVSIGEAFSGEKDIVQAFSEAGTYMFEIPGER